MSPRVRLHTYPHDDREFKSGVTLEIDLPDDGLPIETAVLMRLQAKYPGAAIRVEDGGDGKVAWHVYRDGLPH